MAKLIEASIWNKLLSLFYKSQEDGKEGELLRTLRNKNPEIADIYADWYKKSDAVLQATKKALERRGLDTTEIDDLIRKYS